MVFVEGKASRRSAGSAAMWALYPSRLCALVLRVWRASGPTVEMTRSGATRRAIRQPPWPLQHHHCADHLARDRRVSATLARQVGEQLRWEQLVAVVGEDGVHRPVREQMTTPGRRVQLGIGWVA
jgi:hypothetical protein